ncbi:MAG TPA: Ig-like domain-containing protein, partial [Actinomycetota bacterium]|nr:Ig-like domain-containing protein [Actinomycetota bacterium]
MYRRVAAALVVALLGIAVTGIAVASITAASGEVHRSTLGHPSPSNVAMNQHQHPDAGPGPGPFGAHAFDEEQDYTTKAPIALDNCTMATSAFVTCPTPRGGNIDGFDDLRAGTIPAGTCIDSHLIHADGPGTTTWVYGGLTGPGATEVSFASPIIGIIVTAPRLIASDADPGLAPGTTYGAEPVRGLELSTVFDELQINTSANRIRFRLHVAAADYDQIRVITLGDPNACPGQAKTLTLTPDAAVNQVATQHCVTATAKTDTGGPAANVVVRFDVEGASESDGQPTDEDGSVTTNQDGEAKHCYTGPETVGVDTIHAYADNDRDGVEDLGTEPSDDATKTWAPAAVNTVVLDPKVDTNPVGTQHCLTATVRDVFGNPIPDERVRFVVTGTVDRTGADETDELGVAEFCYSSTTAGADVITAHHDEDNQGTRDALEPFDVGEKTWTPGDPATLVLEPKVAENRIQEQHCVRATVRDAFGNLTPNETVRFEVTGVNTTAGADVTDAGGQARFCYHGGTTAGPDAILAYADEDDDQTQDATETAADTASKLWLPLEPAILTLTPKEDENVVGDQHCVQAAVTDIFLNPNPDEPVRFVVTGTTEKQATVRTNIGGVAEYCYTSTQVGQDAIHAWADSVEEDNEQDPGEPFDDATKTWHPGDPASVVLTPKTSTNEVGTQHCVKAEVRDQFGNPTPDETIVFDVEGASEQDAQPPDEDGSDQTDEGGNAQHCYTGPDLPGSDTITAFADFDPDGTARPNGTRDADEPADTAEKNWIFPPSTPFCEIRITEGGWITTLTGDKGTFGGNASVSPGAPERGELEYHDHSPVMPVNFHSIEIVAIVCGEDGRADIYGLGEVNGNGPVPFRIRLRDGGEPGSRPAGPDTYQIITTAYVSGPEDNPIVGGNIQVHTR